MKSCIISYQNKLVMLFFIVCTQFVYGQTNIKLESDNSFTNTLKVMQDETSNSSSFSRLEDKGVIKWNVVLPDSGYYNVHIRYRAFKESKEQYLLKNNDTIAIGFEISENWNEFVQPFYFYKGENTLGLKESWGQMDIDWFMLSEEKPKVGISPKKQLFVKDIHSLLVFKIDNYHEEIASVLLNEKPIKFSIEPFPYQESAVLLKISEEELSRFEDGNFSLKVVLKNSVVIANLSIVTNSEEVGLTIIVPDVKHGSSVFMRLPSGKNLLIDSGEKWARDSIVIPMLNIHKIDTIHTFIITHYHDDHDSGDRGDLIKQAFNVQQFIDYNTYPTGYVLEQDGVSIKFLNCSENGNEENTKSLAFKITYNGFVYYHGGDTYALNQQNILKNYPNDIKTDVFYANHHFHGSVSSEYILKADPDIVVVQAQEAVYARSAYMVNYRKEFLDISNSKRNEPVETLLGLETGATVISIKSGEEWKYRTHRDQHIIIAPELIKD